PEGPGTAVHDALARLFCRPRLQELRPRDRDHLAGGLTLRNAEEASNAGHDRLLLVGRKLWEDRQRQGLARGTLGFGKTAALVTQAGEAGLLVQRYGIVNLRADFCRRQMLSQLVAAAVGDPDRVLVPDMARSTCRLRQRENLIQAIFREQRVVIQRIRLALA